MMSKEKTAKEIIIETLKKANRPLTASEIRNLTGLNYNTIRGRLQELKKQGIVKNVEGGWILVEKQG